ncbi:alanine dehydrogenase [Mycoplasma mycoides subsp. capri]|uniref:alanine dehydrogenase n=1 Tax=Mycoplasma mycoides TaxID=2102 RepID=UPI0022405CD1|nr:alanine dehydrogenase [Mycoplasma mycoides]UZK64240.1 alanine dehydrogenase [Mycoplasma mycoides subsp. capri]
MKIGLPKEIKQNENRVGITPMGVVELVRNSHEVLVESGAGLGSGFSDLEYEKAGAKITKNVEDVWKQEMIVKVKEPLKSEYKYFYENQIIFTYFHLAGLKDLTEELIKNKVVAIAYETVQTPDKALPLLRPMSEVAGRMAVIIASNLLLKNTNKDALGVLISGTPGTPKANITIIGGGVAGSSALRLAIAMEANVTIIEFNENRIRQLYETYGHKANILKSNYANIAKAVKESDVVISTVLIPGKLAPKLVTTEMVKTMKPNSVIIDVAIDQGGSVETVDHISSHADPTFIRHNVIHYSVPNIPGSVPRTSTIALTNATLTYVVEIASKGWKKAIQDNSALKLGVQTVNGKLVYKNVADSLNIQYTEIDNAI